MDLLEKPYDLYKMVGQRIKERRKSLRITQTQLAEMMDISYQQIQKYETGLNSVSLERLIQFAKLLNVSPDHFYQGITLNGNMDRKAGSDIICGTKPQHLQIVLVEDNLADIMLFRKSLEALPEIADLYCINEANKVMDYLCNYATKYAAPAPDIIVLDLNMPHHAGLKILKDLKSNSQTCIIPVIIFTKALDHHLG